MPDTSNCTTPPSSEAVTINTAALTKKLLTREALDAYDTATEPHSKAMGRRYTHHSQLKGILNNVEEVPEDLYNFFDFRLTPYLAQLMDRDDPKCPIRLQYLPSNNETIVRDYELGDSLGEDGDIHGDGSSVVHRYPQRVLFLVQNTCLSYCRYCTRKRLVSDSEKAIKTDMIDEGIKYIASHPEIQDVLLSGGDPLILSDAKLDTILGRIRAEAPHVKFLRIGSRLPVQLPTRITPELCEILERHDVQMMNIHVNHAKEITPLFKKHIKMLRKAGVMVGNQTVLLRGVNDSVEVLRELCMELVSAGIRPMYAYSNDNAEGNAQFTVTYAEMLKLNAGLRGWISGPAVPTFVVDGMGGLGKMPVQNMYVAERANGEVWGTNYEGKSARQINLEKSTESANFDAQGRYVLGE